MSRFCLLLCCWGVALAGCSLNRIAANQTAAVIVRAARTYDKETDLELAEQAGAANLKLLEGLLEVTPDHPDLLLLASSSFARYAFAFVEGRIDLADQRGDRAEAERLTTRAADFYDRSRTYGLRLISRSRAGFADIPHRDRQALSAALENMDREFVPALFWTAYAWGNLINLEQDRAGRLAELPRVELMMRRVLVLDEAYCSAGPHLFFGVYLAARPGMFGGDPLRAEQHFRRAIELTGGRYLMARFLLARHYAVRVQNRGLFEDSLSDILASSPDLLPDEALANRIARQRAAHWLARADELFYSE